LGVTINSGLVNNRDSAILIGAVMVAVLALVFDFLSALAQKYMKPKGL
jgi:osmoprotectant transport system permease protein